MTIKTQNNYYNPFPWRSIAFLISLLVFATLGLFLWMTDVQAQDETQLLPAGDSLYDLWKNSSNNVFTIGQDSTILHYDGRRWMTIICMTDKSFHSDEAGVLISYPLRSEV